MMFTGQEEVWKDIKGYEGYYQVSSLGRVRSLDRIGFDGRVLKGRLFKPSLTYAGYQVVGAHRDGKQKQLRIHRLVAEAFIPNPENKPEVHHINHIRDDNRVENLMWVNADEQYDDHWLKTREYTGRPSQFIIVNNVGYKSICEAARQLNIPQPTISKALKKNKMFFRSNGVEYRIG